MKSPYLENDSRLAEIIGAIQVMSIYKWASRKSEVWQKSLGEPLGANDWPTVFKEHPEFFRFTKDGWVSLRWRHGYLKTFDPTQGRELSETQVAELTPEQRDALTHKPLTTDQTEALIKTALDFHARAIAHEQERRWRIPFLFGVLTAVLAFAGAILGAYIKSCH
jgi:hypothetical protein